MHDLKYNACPDLPQYGNLHAACPCQLPSKATWTAILPSVISFFFCAGIVKVGLETNLQLPEHIAAPICVAVSLCIASVVYFFLRNACSKNQGLFVFDGGIHLNEEVSYMFSDGNFLSFHSGMRQVSIPWRKIRSFSATEVTRNGQPVVLASAVIPDGRKIVVATDQGGQSGAAIKTLIQNLGS